MKKLKIGDFCIIDQSNTNKLDITSVPIVKIIGRKGFKYIIENVEYDDGKMYLVDGRYLTPISDTNIVIRYPISMPIINEKDLKAMKNILQNYENNKKQNIEDMKRLNMIYLKASHLEDMFGYN